MEEEAMEQALLNATVASVIACLACGLGALPLLFQKNKTAKQLAFGYSFSGGLMFSASVFNLIVPGWKYTDSSHFLGTISLPGGIVSGLLLMFLMDRYWSGVGSRLGTKISPGVSKTSILFFLAMFIHSAPEGVAVGVGYASDIENLGTWIAIAIAVHNIPEGFAISIIYRSENKTSIWKCFWLAVASSLPQPLAAIPAVYAVWLFRPMMVPAFGFAAGAMIYMIMVELIPKALEYDQNAKRILGYFMAGFLIMFFIQMQF